MTESHYERDGADTSLWPAPFRFEVAVTIASDEIVVVYDGQRQWLENPATGHRMPEAFEALVSKPDLPLCQLLIELTPSAGPVCRRLTLADERLTATRIRVPLRQFIDEATRLVGVRPRDTDPAEYDSEEFMRGLAHPEPGKRLPDEILARAAEVYRNALRRGLGPTDAVALAFPISRSTAGRWIVEARRRGLLGPAIPGVAGELEKEDDDG
jgi:hypothetical protein